MRSLSSFIIFVFTLQVGWASTEFTDSLFHAANQEYKAKDYFEAINSYNIIEESGYKSSELFYNMGNSYFKVGDYAKAILYYERAKLLDQTDEDIDFNLVKSKTYIVDKVEIIPEFFLKSWIRGFFRILSSNQWAIISMVMFIVGLGAFLIYFLIRSKQGKKISFFIGLVIFLFFVFTLFASIQTKSYIENSNAAIVLEQMVRVKSSPDNESPDLFIIHEGTKVFLIRQVDLWSEIRLSDGKQGWMLSEGFEKI